MTTTPSPLDNPAIICTVHNTAPFGTLLSVSFRDDEIMWFEFRTDISQFDLTLVDDQFRSVDLNGSPIYVEFEWAYL